MYTKQEIIIRSHREGKSQRCISRELGISRKTVHKYISEFESLQRGSPESEPVISKYLSEPSQYRGSKRPRRKLTSEIQDVIDKLLSGNEKNRQKGMRKQMLKNTDIHAYLISEGYDISYSTVCAYISESKSSSKVVSEAFIRQEYQPGEQCEFDWGLVKLEIGGKVEQIQLAVFTSAYANYRYARLYRRADTLAFQESHVCFIAHCGVVFQQMVYDNMRVAVSRFVGIHEKEPTRALLGLRGHYQFTHRFCNFYRGNEKGHVERSVEYIRRKAFGLKNSFATLEEAQEWLNSVLKRLNRTPQQLTGKTAEELFDEEKKLLPSAPERMRCSELTIAKVDKYSTLCYKGNRYSVPDHLVGRHVDVQISSDTLRIYSEGHLIAEHPRHYGSREWIITIEHYLETFRRKPGALPGSAALAGRTLLKELYQEYFENRVREFIELLSYCHEHSISDDQLSEAVTRLETTGISTITVEHLTALLGNQSKQDVTIPDDSTTTQLALSQLEQQAALFN